MVGYGKPGAMGYQAAWNALRSLLVERGHVRCRGSFKNGVYKCRCRDCGRVFSFRRSRIDYGYRIVLPVEQCDGDAERTKGSGI